MRALCKFRGMLVIAEVTVNENGGSCPECKSTEFFERYGWIECDCGFAYLKSDIERLKVEVPTDDIDPDRV